ncbi:alpha-galactosidase [Pseudonocardia sediminis]|uniref:Alpha-galactosidase n=1 Tax=Pseudonocardia sediminis TaxID=1397368 RepID=A0A4Q7UX12_PSEST|nr:alpha-galactosidase [Pseudonocardia sediminis]RZT86587.1 alpha-galactosidase [Pseudonocardia sediminis]
MPTSPSDAAATLAAGAPLHLRSAGVSAVVVLPGFEKPGDGLPVLLHWGADLGETTPEDLRELARAAVPATANNEVGVPVVAGVLPEHATGWNGRPGLSGSRAGRGWSPWFRRTGVSVKSGSDGGDRIVVSGHDSDAGLDVVVEMELLPSGLLRQRATVTAGDHPSRVPYALGGLGLTVPLPPEATEVFDLAGRWGRERAPQRRELTVGVHSRENRRGRTGPDAPLILAAGTAGFGFRGGEVWAVHTAWSGNHVTYAERLSTGASVLGGGELLLPGEVVLAAGESYASPWLYAAHGIGLDAVAAQFHTHLRARPSHPSTPRPVVVNNWEATYFDHDVTRLTELARRAADVGAERFVLDDGWFRHRRDDTAGLGDWYVDESVWPDGLTPFVETVRGLGMEFGLWVEPEMVNPDSDLARAHPDWILATGGRTPVPSRNQQVLDLAHPDAYRHILDRLDAILSADAISSLKWDHNRDLVDAGHSPGGEPGVHAQTAAVHRLLDELRTRHPEVEIESCSSGGLRVDLAILERTDRVWGSDCIDALERQQIQRWTAQLLPPELIGSHVGAARAHTTARTHDLSFRAGTALFCSFGIEWDLTVVSDDERAELAAWVALHKELRPLLHSGTVVRADSPDPASALHGVVAADGSEAVFALVQLDAPLTSVPGRIRLPGLDPDRRYRVTAANAGGLPALRHRPPPWVAEGVTLSGAALGHAGVRAPSLQPEHLVLLRATAV